MKKWHNYLKAAIGTIAAISIWIGAITCLQPAVTPPPLPIAACGVNQWVLLSDYQSAVTVSGVTYAVTIRAGFRSDLASIAPVIAAALGVDRDSPAIRRGALIHDAIYAAHLTSRQTADSILYVICLADGMAPAKARAVYQAVSEWGWGPWERTPEQISAARQLVSVSAR